MYLLCFFCFFFFNDTATTEIYTLSLHDALPIYGPPLSDAHDQISCPRPLSYIDRKSTRLNSSHLVISYAVFCLKKKKIQCHTASTARQTDTVETPHTPLTPP